MEFEKFEKIARLNRNCVITEKIDGTNASIHIDEEGNFFVGSRTRFITPEEDNYGFAKWAYENKEELMKLGEGRHYGEWWGQGVQRKYNMDRKVFSLFNAGRWTEETKPECCSIVPVLYEGLFSNEAVNHCLDMLRTEGSKASEGFMKPEGVVVYHVAVRKCFKVTLEKDESPKGLANDH